MDKNKLLMVVTEAVVCCAALAVVAGCRHVPDDCTESVAPFSGDRAVLPGSPCGAAPAKAELLHESGTLALFSGETAEDTAFNEADATERDYRRHNSLFLRRRKADGTDEWRLLLTSGSDWRAADGMDRWDSSQAGEVRGHFKIRKASFGLDGRHLWLVCDTHTSLYSVVCSYDVQDNVLKVMIDGDTAAEQPDGTILVTGKKVYLQDENGEPDGAGLCDVWITPDGKIVRKSKPVKING